MNGNFFIAATSFFVNAGILFICSLLFLFYHLLVPLLDLSHILQALPQAPHFHLETRYLYKLQNQDECKSEVAHFRKLLELECEAMKLGLSGFAVMARHEIIHNRYNNLGTYEKELAKYVGEEKAHEVMVAYIKVMG